MQIRPGHLDDPRVVELLTTHISRALAATGRGSAHALDLDGLRSPGIWFWGAWEGETVLGTAALRRLSGEHGEVKSMFVAEAGRRKGVASALVLQVVETARAEGMNRLSLETGSADYFLPARAMYARNGFVECGPFGEYGVDPNSVFMTRTI